MSRHGQVIGYYVYRDVLLHHRPSKFVFLFFVSLSNNLCCADCLLFYIRDGVQPNVQFRVCRLFVTYQ